MARKARVEYEGAVYHVLDRGDRREALFLDDGDRRRFLETLGEACGRTGWRVHAYVLMSNHYHLMIETPQANLVAGMRWFQTTWTMRFNRRHRLSGHLFASRSQSAALTLGTRVKFGWPWRGRCGSRRLWTRPGSRSIFTCAVRPMPASKSAVTANNHPNCRKTCNDG
jgi:REP element-mobilizing transposase RayT